MLKLVRRHHPEQTTLEKDADERRRRGVTFRDLAHEWLTWLVHMDKATPGHLLCWTTARALCQPRTPYRRGPCVTKGLVTLWPLW